MKLLALDIGSSSIKAGVLRSAHLIGLAVREEFPTRYDESRAEVRAEDILAAVARAIQRLGPPARSVDLVGLSAMAPSWVAMDAGGRAITPVVTHQDRRSVDVARQLIARIGRDRILGLCGNLPFPGGISSTTCAWFVRNEPAVMRRADLVGHFSTYLNRQLCGTRVIDPSHAAFMGLYSTLDLRGWSEELCSAVGIKPRLLPEVRQSNQVAGRLLPAMAGRLGLPAGLPILAGMVDTGAAMLLAGAAPGQLVNVCGSTDVLALCTTRPAPNQRLLTRPLGVGRKWLSVSTLAAAGSTLSWAQERLFADMSQETFYRMVGRLARQRRASGSVRFEPYLAGNRMSIEQRCGAFTGLTLSTTRQQMLVAMIEALSRASAERIELLRSTGAKMRCDVLVSGGAGSALAGIIHRDWPGRWSFRKEKEATLRGLGMLAGS